MVLVDRLEEVLYRLRPTWQDGTQEFRKLLWYYIANFRRVLDAGAGSRSLINFRGKGPTIVGIDLDPMVTKNPGLDFPVIGDLYWLPFAENSFDAIYSDYVWEHLQSPEAVGREFFRVLRTGGILTLRTPNRHHYVALLSRFTPHLLHTIFIRRFRGISKDHIFPTVYASNTRQNILKNLNNVGFKIISIQAIEKEPSYLKWNAIVFLLGVIYERVVNSTTRLEALRSNWIVIAQKP